MQKDTHTAFLRGLRQIVLRPILFVDLLLGERNRLRLDYRPVREYVPLVNDGSRVEVFAGVTALGMVQASTGFRVQIDAIGAAIAVGLAGHNPGAIVKTVQAASRRDNQAALFPGVHCCDLRDD